MAKHNRPTTAAAPAAAAAPTSDAAPTPEKQLQMLFSTLGMAPSMAGRFGEQERAELLALGYDAKGKIVADWRLKFRDWWVAAHQASVQTENEKLAATTKSRLASRGRQKLLNQLKGKTQPSGSGGDSTRPNNAPAE